MANNFERLGTASEVRRAQQVAFSIHMISIIAAGYDSVVDRGDMLCAYTMIDSFYVNIRLVAEFLTRRTSNMDFGPGDFVVDWSPPKSEAAKRLSIAWETASGYVVHLSTRRVPDELEDLAAFGVSGSSLRAMSADALEVFAKFVELAAQQAPPWVDGARIPNPEKEPAAWHARLQSEVVAILTTALEGGHAANHQ